MEHTEHILAGALEALTFIFLPPEGKFVCPLSSPCLTSSPCFGDPVVVLSGASGWGRRELTGPEQPCSQPSPYCGQRPPHHPAHQRLCLLGPPTPAPGRFWNPGRLLQAFSHLLLPFSSESCVPGTPSLYHPGPGHRPQWCLTVLSGGRGEQAGRGGRLMPFPRSR